MHPTVVIWQIPCLVFYSRMSGRLEKLFKGGIKPALSHSFFFLLFKLLHSASIQKWILVWQYLGNIASTVTNTKAVKMKNGTDYFHIWSQKSDFFQNKEKYIIFFQAIEKYCRASSRCNEIKNYLSGVSFNFYLVSWILWKTSEYDTSPFYLQCMWCYFFLLCTQNMKKRDYNRIYSMIQEVYQTLLPSLCSSLSKCLFSLMCLISSCNPGKQVTITRLSYRCELWSDSGLDIKLVLKVELKLRNIFHNSFFFHVTWQRVINKHIRLYVLGLPSLGLLDLTQKYWS